MGKRELLLVALFVVLGTVLYQATAPPAPDGARGFSLREMFRAARGHMGDHPASRTVTQTSELRLPGDSTVLVIDEFRGRVDVQGDDVTAVAATLESTLHGLDEDDLDRQESALGLRLEAEGSRATLVLDEAEGAPRADRTLTLHVPRALTLHLSGRGVAHVRGMAGAQLDDYRGDLTIEDVTGPVTGSHAEGRAEFGPGTAVTLETRRGTLRLVRPASATLEIEAVDVEVTDAAGPVTIDEERSTIEVIGGAGPIRVTGAGGTIKLRNVQTPVEIDAERLTVSMAMAQAVTATVQVEGDDVDVTLPAAGVTLEASVERGELRAPETFSPTVDGDVRRAAGALNGGGPTVTVQVTRGSLTIRTP